MPHKTKRQEKRLAVLKKNKRISNPWALENWIEKRERAKRRRPRTK